MNKEKVLNEVMEWLDKESWAKYCKPHAIKDVLRRSKLAKSSLIDVLRKSPNWNEEEGCIIKDGTYKRWFNIYSLLTFKTYLIYTDTYRNLTQEAKYRITRVFDLFLTFTSPFFMEKDKETVDKINSLNPEYKLHYTGKVSKAIRKICKEEGLDKEEDFEKEFTKLSDLLNPLEIPVKEVLSVNPVDYLLMSNGDSWTSCQNIYDGCSMTGTISYMLDEDSLIYFQVPRDTPVKKIHSTDKILRQVWMYKDEGLMQSRLYPQDNDSDESKDLYNAIRTSVLDEFSKILDVKSVESPWKTSHKAVYGYVTESRYSAAYPDWVKSNEGSHKCTISVLNSRTKMLPTFVGGEDPICLCCGENNYEGDSLLCWSCKQKTDIE